MNSSPALNLVILAVSVVVAIVAYKSSESFKKKNGVTPWHWPSWLWAFVGFLSFLLCAILYSIASRRTKAVPFSALGTSPGDLRPTVTTPAYANVAPDQNGWGQVPASSVPRPDDNPGDNTEPPGAWHGDPTGRYAARYWDGAAWTEHVSDGQTTTSDPL
jgi:hypothetical protein